MLLRNFWYVAAWADELTDAPLARTILGEPIVLFRGADGKPAALQDRCPHRALPLSLGRVVEGRLQCGYHGLEFDAAGICTRIPGQQRIPAGFDAMSYPTVERWRWIWVWLGEGEADPALIPAFPWLTEPGWVAPTGSFRIKASHELLIENLHNHTHLQFVHARTIGTDGIAEVRPEISRDGDQVRVDRWLLGRPAPALFARVGGFSGPVDRWFNSVFLPPSNVILDIGCAAAGSGAPQGDRSRGIEIRSLHAITPETETTTHYFWAYARNFSIDDTAVTEALRAGATATFAEDVAVLEAQQQSLERLPGLPLNDIAVDAAPLLVQRVRRELQARGKRVPA